MAIALVSAGATVSGPPDLQGSFGQATAAGNLLIGWFVVVSAGGVQPTINQSWSTIAVATLSNSWAMIFAKPNCGAGETAPLVHWGISVNGFLALAEFSGATTAPTDQHGANTGPTSPVTATSAGADAAANELQVGVSDSSSTKAGTTTTSHTYGIGATQEIANNDALSDVQHYHFSWALTGTALGTDSLAAADAGMSLSFVLAAIASFRPTPPPPSFAQQGSLRNDPDSIQNIGQAVKRGAYYCLGEKWARRRSGLIAPGPGRDFVLA